MDKNKIAILYIATGKYFVFWEGFYQSAKKYLFNKDEYEVHFFLFTDKELSEEEDVTIISIKNEIFPLVPLQKFHYFLQIEATLNKYDFIYLFNSNSVILRSIDEDILPKNDAKFSFMQQPYTLSQTINEFGYERRKESMAYIEYGVGHYYIWAAFFGGRSLDFLKMSKIIKNWTDVDMAKNIIVPFWDESYLNKYLLQLKKNDYTLLDTNLLLVDGYNDNGYINNKAFIHILEKSLYFDTSFKIKLSFKEKIKQKIKSIIKIR